MEMLDGLAGLLRKGVDADRPGEDITVSGQKGVLQSRLAEGRSVNRQVRMR